MIRFKKTELAVYLENRVYDKSLEGQVIINFTPTRATIGSAGYDLCYCGLENITLQVGEVVKLGTGVHIYIGNMFELTDGSPYVGFAGLLMPRSSSKGAILNNTIGLLDSDYQGELFCKYRNITSEPITIEVGERFAQLVIVPVSIGGMLEVDSFTDSTERGNGGFGSTGY
jgi:dUTP pyrophosphatase